MDWFFKNIIYLTVTGSRCYNLDNELSDVDFKGIVIPPREIREHLFNHFEQAINNVEVEDYTKHLVNKLNPKQESTVYSLSKFIQLAAAVNPNIIEVLFTEPQFHIIKKPIFNKLYENRDLFLSKRAYFCFLGFSTAQIQKLERHKKWLDEGEIKKPERKDYGLPDIIQQFDEVSRFIKRKVEEWNLSSLTLDEFDRNDLKERCWEVIYEVSNLKVGGGNWPEKYADAAQAQLIREFDFKGEVVEVINREITYRRDLEKYKAFLNWKNNRNPERAKLESKCHYDSKHASQSIRLQLLGIDILTNKNANVFCDKDRRELLLDIKNGHWSYERVLTYSEELTKEMEKAFQESTLPKSVDYFKINDLYHSILSKYENV